MAGATIEREQPENPAYRPDIDGLRAVAILAVLAYHFFPGRAPGGFFGVDIFFVISGYLITGLLLRERERGPIDLIGFYARRVRRLFPALLLVVAACSAAAFFLMFSFEYERFARHIYAALAFLENFQLAGEAGYFDSEARAKPLLHFWSLAIEEQFYLVWPLLLILVGRWPRLTGGALLLIVLASLAFTVAGPLSAEAAFYSPLPRAWELAAGGLLAWREMSRSDRPVGRFMLREAGAAIGIAAIVLVVLIGPRELPHPGWITLVPAVATMMLIASGPGAWLNRRLAWRPVLGVGLISYPLYLWHWPLLAFPFIVTGETLPPVVRLALIALSFALAWATYAFVEQPIRAMRARRAAIWLVAAAVGVAGASLAAVQVHNSAPDDHAAAVQGQLTGPLWSHTRNAMCEERYGSDQRYFCIQNRPGPPTLMLIGNSYANHLYYGLASNPVTAGHTILSVGACDASGTFPEGRRDCARQDEIALASPGLEVAVVSSLWPRFDVQGRMVEQGGGAILSGHPDATFYARALIARLRRLRARGVSVLIVGPKPELDYDVADCFPRPLRGPKHDCVVQRAAAEAETGRTRALLIAVAHAIGATYFDPQPLFCDAQACRYINRDGLPLLRDNGHYSEIGSRLVVDALVRQAAAGGLDLRRRGR